MVDNPLDLDNLSGHTIQMYNKLVTPDSLFLPTDITHDKTLI